MEAPEDSKLSTVYKGWTFPLAAVNEKLRERCGQTLIIEAEDGLVIDAYLRPEQEPTC